MRTLRNLSIALCSVLLVTGSLGLSGCASSKYQRSAGRTVDDATITAKVKTDLLQDSAMRGSNINVDTFNGNVQLNGWVDTPEQKEQAERIAQGVNGVASVQNNLELKEAAGAPTP